MASQSAGRRLTIEFKAYARDSSFARIPAEPAERKSGRLLEMTASVPGAKAMEIVVRCELNEHFAGLGEQFTQVDKRGRVIDGWAGVSVNAPVSFAKGLDGGYKTMPVYYSSTGYAAVINSLARWRIEFAVGDPYEVVLRVPGDSIELTFIEGFPADVLPELSAKWGRPPLAPPWAYGVWRAMRGGHEAVIEDARRMREAGLPASATWLDAHYQPDTNSGFPAAGSYPLGEYPSIRKTVSELHALGFKALSYVNPFVYRNTPAFDEAVEKGYVIQRAEGGPALVTMLHPFEGDAYGFLETTGVHALEDGVALVDFTNPEAVRWWKGLLRKILTEEDFDGWMEDFGEGVPPESVMFNGSTPDTAHNMYSLLYHRTAAEERRTSKPDAVAFARSAALGSQQDLEVFWPGDQVRDWSREAGIGQVPAAGISIGLMGVAAWGSDIAAVMDVPGLPMGHGGGSEDKELWIRWCQLAAMSPVMREHLGFHLGDPPNVWTDDDTIDMWRRCGQWHLRLFPYLYSFAAITSETGLPVLRGMMVEFPDHEESWVLSDQYLLGDALLCAPVIDKGVRSRRVWIPPSSSWTDCFTGAIAEGGWREIEALLERWPVMQRAGTVVPMLADSLADLNDPKYASGNFDIELRSVSGVGSYSLQMFDGTLITGTPASSGWQVAARGPERSYRLATADGQVIDEASGSTVTFVAP